MLDPWLVKKQNAFDQPHAPMRPNEATAHLAGFVHNSFKRITRPVMRPQRSRARKELCTKALSLPR